MKHIVRAALVLAIALAAINGGRAAGTLTAGDLAWLSTTLNLPPDSPLDFE